MALYAKLPRSVAFLLRCSSGLGWYSTGILNLTAIDVNRYPKCKEAIVH